MGFPLARNSLISQTSFQAIPVSLILLTVGLLHHSLCHEPVLNGTIFSAWEQYGNTI